MGCQLARIPSSPSSFSSLDIQAHERHLHLSSHSIFEPGKIKFIAYANVSMVCDTSLRPADCPILKFFYSNATPNIPYATYPLALSFAHSMTPAEDFLRMTSRPCSNSHMHRRKLSMCPAWPSPLVDDTERPDIDAEKNRRPVVHVFAKFPDRALRLVSQICATFVKGQTKVVRWSHAARTKKIDEFRDLVHYQACTHLLPLHECRFLT